MPQHFKVYKKTEEGMNEATMIGRLVGISPKESGTDLIVLKEDGQLTHEDIKAVLVKEVE